MDEWLLQVAMGDLSRFEYKSKPLGPVRVGDALCAGIPAE